MGTWSSSFDIKVTSYKLKSLYSACVGSRYNSALIEFGIVRSAPLSNLETVDIERHLPCTNTFKKHV